MDTVTQFALGAVVGVGLLGARVGPRRAIVAGGVLGVVPDLDVLVPFDNPVDAFVQHRGFSHSLFIQAVATPVFGEALMRLVRALRDHRVLAYLAVYLCFATHALLDSLTVYGTQLLWPFSLEPFAVSSIFIIDPLYSLPLFAMAIWALCCRVWSARLQAAAIGALLLSTAYLGWGVFAQQRIAERAETVLAGAGIEPKRMLAIPTPFNSLFWRVIALDGGRYLNLYLPLFGPLDGATIYAHARGNDLATCLAGNRALDKLAWFSRGFYRLELNGAEVVLSDLRMGLTPNYVFRFAIAEKDGRSFRTILPRSRGIGGGADGDLDWLLANLRYRPARRPIEAIAYITAARLAAAEPMDSKAESC